MTREDVEKAVADFAGIVSGAALSLTDKVMEELATRLCDYCAVDTASNALKEFPSILEKYFYNPNSPLRDEDIFGPFAEKLSGSPLLENGGEVCGNVCGCYIHGIFDSDCVSEAVVKELYRIKKIPYTGGSLNRQKYRESQYDLIADNFRNSIDTEMLYRIIGV